MKDPTCFIDVESSANELGKKRKSKAVERLQIAEPEKKKKSPVQATATTPTPAADSDSETATATVSKKSKKKKKDKEKAAAAAAAAAAADSDDSLIDKRASSPECESSSQKEIGSPAHSPVRERTANSSVSDDNTTGGAGDAAATVGGQSSKDTPASVAQLKMIVQLHRSKVTVFCFLC